MKNIVWIILVLFFISCQTDSSKNTSEQAAEGFRVQLLCEDIDSDDMQPHFGIYAIVNNSKTKIKEMYAICETIDNESFADYEIPADATSAVGGWWAGGGDYFYAKQNAEIVTFYHAAVDEMQEGAAYAYEPIATYEKGRFSVSLGK